MCSGYKNKPKDTQYLCSHLASISRPAFEDNEKSFMDLYTRIDKSIDFLESVKPEQVDGSAEKPISFEVRGHTLNFSGMGMLLNFSLPNVYFHITTAYNILRHNGVGIGKIDFLGDPTA